MYHYVESGLQNIWLKNGFETYDTSYGKGVAIHDVEGLHRIIGHHLARRSHLTGSGLRFLRKEMGLSQRALAKLVGGTEQNVSLWERRGRMPKASDRLVRLLYIELIDGNAKIRELMDTLEAMDTEPAEKMRFEEKQGQWKEAA